MTAGSHAIMDETRYRKSWKYRSESAAVIFPAAHIEILFGAKVFPEKAPTPKPSTKAIISPVLTHHAMKGGRA
jgi:hypothetical protein